MDYEGPPQSKGEIDNLATGGGLDVKEVLQEEVEQKFIYTGDLLETLDYEKSKDDITALITLTKWICRE